MVVYFNGFIVEERRTLLSVVCFFRPAADHLEQTAFSAVFCSMLISESMCLRHLLFWVFANHQSFCISKLQNCVVNMMNICQFVQSSSLLKWDIAQKQTLHEKLYQSVVPFLVVSGIDVICMVAPPVIVTFTHVTYFLAGLVVIFLPWKRHACGSPPPPFSLFMSNQWLRYWHSSGYPAWLQAW